MKMKKKNDKLKNPLKDFFKELFAGFVIILIFLLLFAIGLFLLSLLPKEVSNNFPIEVVVILGFFAFLAILYLISKIVCIVRTLKTKSVDNKTIQENKETSE